MIKFSYLKHTRVYQEALEEGRQQGRQEALEEELQQGRVEGIREGKLEVVPILLKAGVSVEEIAQHLELEIEAVRQIAQQQC
ncbi:hypothetical protein ACE1AT_14580 [Pelatocladus sp. BLCC-F211]|uniref:hypothetical protein n=1 Tax=Pelatocladus sp. BLCC-F211 TaxID=3342752 RepID=UPI0035BB06DD